MLVVINIININNMFHSCIKINGSLGAVIEVLLFGVAATSIFTFLKLYNDIDPVSYYWMTFTSFIGILEGFYIIFHSKVICMATELIQRNEHVWCKLYPWVMILPHNLSCIFYAEYGAWADREYMVFKDFWSRLIEGTHALFCGLFCLVALILYCVECINEAKVALAVGMGCQLMNSILYIGEYFIQTSTEGNVNYPTTDFPMTWKTRFFMFINVFWTVMPIYSIIMLFVY